MENNIRKSGKNLELFFQQAVATLKTKYWNFNVPESKFVFIALLWGLLLFLKEKIVTIQSEYSAVSM